MLAARERVSSYAAVRPPGHHAGPAWHGGYCFINNAVVAARVLQEEGLSTVAILDIDYHLGNGTLACVAGDLSLPYFSLHSDRLIDFPYSFPGGPGLFGISSAPTPDHYLKLLASVLTVLRDIRPDALVVSLGYDILDGDPHGSWSLPPSVFAGIGAILVRERLPTVYVQEGGYGLPSLHEAAQALAEGVA
jgi:acetoin utilization deacetylase AcuC-like enzyme